MVQNEPIAQSGIAEADPASLSRGIKSGHKHVLSRLCAISRLLRIAYGGAWHHVMNCGRA